MVDTAALAAAMGGAQPTLRGSGQTNIDPKLTQAMMMQGLNPGPVTSKTQMWAKLGTTAIGGVLENMRQDKAQAIKDRIAETMATIPGVASEIQDTVRALAKSDPKSAIALIMAERDRAAKERMESGKAAKYERVEIGGSVFQRNMKTDELKAMPGTGDTPAIKHLRRLGEIGKDGRITPRGRTLLEQTFKGKGDVNISVDMGNQKKTNSTLEQQALDVVHGLDRLKRITALVKPKYLTTPYRIKIAALRDRARGGIAGTALNFFQGGITEDDKRELAEFRAFEVEALTNINRYIKEITGAQMSELEAKRLRGALPDPGDKNSWLKFDDPETFQAGLDQAKATLRAVLARTIAMRKRGVVSEAEPLFIPGGIENGEQVYFRRKGVTSLDEMERTMNSRKIELRRGFKKNGLEGENLDRMVYQSMQKEFFTP